MRPSLGKKRDEEPAFRVSLAIRGDAPATHWDLVLSVRGGPECPAYDGPWRVRLRFSGAPAEQGPGSARRAREEGVQIRGANVRGFQPREGNKKQVFGDVRAQFSLIRALPGEEPLL